MTFSNGLKDTVVYRISHCEELTCDLGMLEYDCGNCGNTITTTTGWYDHCDGKSFVSECCEGTYSYNKDLMSWVLS